MTRTSRQQSLNNTLDARLAAYLAATAATAMYASATEGAVVQDLTERPFGVNGHVNIDFNTDGQTDFQIDHDRVDLSGVGGQTLDYLQLDKNDVNGQTNPLDFDPITGNQAATFSDGITTRNDANNSAYLINPNQPGSYPAALTSGSLIGPTSSFSYDESNNFQAGGKWIRANRLLDEDATQIDQILGGRPASGVQVPFNGPSFDGLAGEIRYLGVKMELNNSDVTNYGWIGIRIDNEADATGAVVGYGYETVAGVPITAGPIPEPGSALMTVAIIVGCCLRRRISGARR
jgi:hypothetical protein